MKEYELIAIMSAILATGRDAKVEDMVTVARYVLEEAIKQQNTKGPVRP